MSVWASGVLNPLRDKVPHVIYMYCYVHRLNLVLMNSLKTISQLNDVLDTKQARHVLFVEARKELDQKVLELERPANIHCNSTDRSNCKIKMRYEAVLFVLCI